MFIICMATLVGFSVFGCGAPKGTEIQVNPANDPLDQPRAVLKRYAAGEPMGSEATSFEYMVNEVRKQDTKRADILEKGLKEIQDNPKQAKAKAKALLDQLAPSMK
jgi:hypothetical protein